jgi:large subunit ribosomal protein L20
MPYSTFIHSLKEQNIQVNRKVLAELAMNEPYSFQALVNQVRAMKGLPAAPSQNVSP